MKRRFYVDIQQAYAEVTGTFILVVVKIDDKTFKFVVDCGLYQEREYDESNKVFITNPSDVLFVVLTHNHVDHNGRLPYFVLKGFRGYIYTTDITRKILDKGLRDNAKVIRDSCKKKGEKPLYDTDAPADVMPLVVSCDYNKPIQVNEYIRLTLIPNGHLIGAASVLVQIHCPREKKDINLFFTGDYNNKNMFFRVPPIRNWIKELPITIITESTYGYMNSSKIKKVFESNVIKAIKEGKTIVTLVFSLGRAQEILYFFKMLQNKYPDVFENIPIYYDGKLSFYYTDMYQHMINNGELRVTKGKEDFIPNNLERVNDKNMRKSILSDPSQKIIITTSGMGSYGPAQTYIPYYITKENALIHFTGYCAEGTLGYRLKSAAKGDIVEVGGSRMFKMADVEFTNEFSAHAKADELIKLLKKFNKPLCILVTHGESETKRIFADRVLREVGIQHVEILGNGNYYRIDSNGWSNFGNI